MPHDLGLHGAAGVVDAHGVETDTAAADHHARLAGTDETGLHAALPGGAVELQRGGHLADRHVGADEEHALAGQVTRPSRAARETRRLAAHVPDGDARPERRGDPGVLPEAGVQAAPDRDAAPHGEAKVLHPFRRNASAARRQSDREGGGFVRQRLGYRRHDRDVTLERQPRDLAQRAARGVTVDHGHDFVPAVTQQGDAGLAVLGREQAGVLEDDETLGAPGVERGVSHG